MVEFSFDGRVAIVTGAGRGIGRAHAHLLAERGASVVVNDLGGSMDGVGADAEPSRTVAAEIAAAGGIAVADNNDVATAAGGEAIMAKALERFGRVDILINNAGIAWYGGLPDVGLDNLERHIAVHLFGAFNTTRAAWPQMVKQGYGRIVMTTSSAIFGMPPNLSYAAAKGATIGLARAVAVTGAAHDIKVNLISPAAHTRMGLDPETGEPLPIPGARPEQMPPELVAPMVAFLVHESCPVTGEIYQAGAGRLSRIFIASTDGYVHRDPVLSIEDVAENWAAINDETSYVVPTDLGVWLDRYMAHFTSPATD